MIKLGWSKILDPLEIVRDRMNQAKLKQKILAAYQRTELLKADEYLALLDNVNSVFSQEVDYRPRDSNGLPGGLVRLNPDITTVILPDLHGRKDFLLSVLLGAQIDGIEKMVSGKLQIVCVGDAFHGEMRVVQRWYAAYQEYQGGFQAHRSMDLEMLEGLGVMEMVMLVKSALPASFHFLKGNHENITNEYGGGNFPFVKFVEEGAMVASYCEKIFGRAFVDAYYRFEKNFPLLAMGGNFLVSHAEPRRFFSPAEIYEYRNRADVVEGMTWTDNGAAEEGSVLKMLERYIEMSNPTESYYFGGHRPIRDLYNLRAHGRYVQIHNPGKHIFVCINPGIPIDLARDVREMREM